MTGSDPRSASAVRDVFISYDSHEEDRASLILMHLEASGLACWKAPRDIPSGQRYATAIVAGMESASAVLLVYGDQTADSAHVVNEIERAVSTHKPIVVVRVDGGNPSHDKTMSFFLQSQQWFDATQGSLSSHMPKLVADVRLAVQTGAGLDARMQEQHADLAAAAQPLSNNQSNSRPPSRSEIVGPVAIGIDVGATKIRTCVLDLGNPTVRSSRDYKVVEVHSANRNQQALLRQVRDLARELVVETQSSFEIAGVGVSVPGQVDVRAGTLKFGPNLFGARNLPIRTHLQAAFPEVPVRVDNDIRCATRSELHFGVGRQFDSFVCVFVGSGVGSGAVIDRRLHFGHNFCAGEIGHTKIALAGPPCGCGQTGCLESFIKADALVARAKAKGIDYESRGTPSTFSTTEEITPQSIVAAIEANDAAALELADELGRHLGVGVANYLNVLNPSAVVICGALMSGFFFHVIPSLTSAVQAYALAEIATTPIVQSSYGDDGIALGAALMFHPNDGWPFG